MRGRVREGAWTPDCSQDTFKALAIFNQGLAKNGQGARLLRMFRPSDDVVLHLAIEKTELLAEPPTHGRTDSDNALDHLEQPEAFRRFTTLNCS